MRFELSTMDQTLQNSKSRQLLWLVDLCQEARCLVSSRRNQYRQQASREDLIGSRVVMSKCVIILTISSSGDSDDRLSNCEDIVNIYERFRLLLF